MPTFEKQVEFDFEAYCENCNSGMCNNCDISKTHSRRMDCISITPCSDCLNAAKAQGEDEMEAKKDKEIEALQDAISELEGRIEALLN